MAGIGSDQDKPAARPPHHPPPRAARPPRLRGARGAAIWLVLAACALFAPAAATAASCPGYSVCPILSYPAVLKTDPDAIRVATGVDASEAAALEASTGSTLTAAAMKSLLGKLLMFDRTLSVNGNQACASCHTAGAGFTGGIASINRSVVSFPGSVTTRTGNRRPMSLAYAAFYPVLHYDEDIGDLVGGNFWDMRATGLLTGSPAGDQALGPPTNPAEMALPDQACTVYRVSVGHYAAFFKRVWGAAILNIGWPANTAAICAVPNTGAANQTPLALTLAARKQANAAYLDIGRSIAAFEASAEVSPFSSKFDAFLAGKVKLTAQESLGLQVFRNQGRCDQCHVSTGAKPLFTNFISSNLGLPVDPSNPYFHENKPDPQGFVANPAGPAYVDQGVGGVDLSAIDPDWLDDAPTFVGKFQVPTLRNVAAVPRAGFQRSYMHNGYFVSLPLVVHFYNTRDTLTPCWALKAGVTHEIGVNCWPVPAVQVNMERHTVGNLQLSAAQEAAIVAFLGTLTDGYVVPAK
jgi:cytochrome c peroxidase